MSLHIVRQLALESASAEIPDESQMQRALDVAVTAMLASHDAPGGAREVVVRVVDAEQSQALNHQWRGKDYATNVLAFPADSGLPTPAGELAPAGDLVVCASVVAREAAEQGKTVADHWAHMIIHGTLHLLGFDHIGDSDASEMEDLECRALAQLGIANPYL